MATPALGPFDSAWLKWGRAMEHGETLKADILKVASNRDADLITTKTQYDAKRRGFRLIVTDIAPVPASWALILGDTANNYRCALDHLAWALVERGKTPPATLKGKGHGVYFPICSDLPRFESIRKSYLPGVRRADLAIVCRHPPYPAAPTQRSRDPIAMLQWINNADKHRTVHPLWSFPFGAEMEITEERGCTVTRFPSKWRTRLVEIDTELGCIGVRKTTREAQPYIEVKHFFALQPAITDGIGLHEWLIRINGAVLAILSELSDPPVDLVASAIRLP
jgi:hypothetical protein